VIGRARSRMIGERKKRRTPAHRRVTKNFDPWSRLLNVYSRELNDAFSDDTN
jgi:hypothetical protein